MDLTAMFERAKSINDDPVSVCLAARKHEIKTMSIIRSLRWGFGLSLVEAKECLVKADEGVGRLNEYQALLLPQLEKVFAKAE